MMKNHTLLFSLLAAGLIHAALFLCDLPPAHPVTAEIPTVLRVAIVAAPLPALSAPTAGSTQDASRPKPPVHQPRKLPQRIHREHPPKQPEKAPAPEAAPSVASEPPIEMLEEQSPPEPQAPAEPSLQTSADPKLFHSLDASRGEKTVNRVATAHSSLEATGGYSMGTVPSQGRETTVTIAHMPAYSHNPKPKYPRTARLAGQEGTALLHVEVLSNGRAGRIVVVKSTGYELLDREAVRAVQRWRFSPAQKGSLPVTAWVRIPIEFHLTD